LEQTQRDAAQAKHNRKYVRQTLSTLFKFYKWTHRHIAVQVKDCLGGLVSGGGDEGDCEFVICFRLKGEGSHGRWKGKCRRGINDDTADCYVSRGSVSGGGVRDSTSTDSLWRTDA
jgi:hypothetical protein